MTTQTTTVSGTPQSSSDFTLTTGIFSDAHWILSGNDSNSTDFANLTTTRSWNSKNGQGLLLPRWQIYLIVGLTAAAIFIFAAMVLIWKLCGKPDDESRSPEVDTPTYRGCCKISRKNVDAPSAAENGTIHQRSNQNEYQRDHEGHEIPMESKGPLPPTGPGFTQPTDQNVVLQGGGSVPRRLAPLNQQAKNVSTTNLAGGTIVQSGNRKTGSAYAPLQQYLPSDQLKGVPMIPVPLEQRRPLPPPPRPPSD